MCHRCGAAKPQSDYYANDKTCKTCRCALVRERRRTNPAVQEYDRKRGNRQSLTDLQRYRAENPAKYKAQTAVNNAVRDGRLTKLANCEVCDSDFHVEGHHDDYAYPLTVRWLCSMCHSAWHAEHGEAKNSKENRMRVIVVTGFELGWDCVVGIFPVEEWSQVQERFPEERYYVQTKTIDSVEEWD